MNDELDVDQGFTPEVKVIGLEVEEATNGMDKSLDEAYIAGAETVRIVHKHGAGALLREIAQLLTGHTHVERFHAAPNDQSDAEATIAALKK